MSKKNIFITDWVPLDYTIEEERLNKLGWTWEKPPKLKPTVEEQEQDLIDRVKKAGPIDGILFSMAPVTAKVIAALPDNCVHIQRQGIGLDLIDQEAAKKRGITVGNTPEYAIEEVMVQALAMIFGLHRQIRETQLRLARGGWSGYPPKPIDRLSTLTVGLIGLGRIGRRVATAIKPFVKRVIFHDPVVTQAPEGLEAVALEELLRTADIVSLHCPLIPSTRHIINKESLAKMKKEAILVNVSRGALVDPVALDEALTNGTIAGAALDVYEPEVLAKESPLHKHDNILLTSHTAWYSKQSVIDCRIEAIEKLIAAVQARQR
jgi:D-3-phosphoglycerate dehydrogenase / 2-oxoglutarate reductase